MVVKTGPFSWDARRFNLVVSLRSIADEVEATIGGGDRARMADRIRKRADEADTLIKEMLYSE